MHSASASSAGQRRCAVQIVVHPAAKLAWGALVPVLLAGAVEQGLVSPSLPWGSAVLIAALAGALLFFWQHPRRHDRHPVRSAGGA